MMNFKPFPFKLSRILLFGFAAALFTLSLAFGGDNQQLLNEQNSIPLPIKKVVYTCICGDYDSLYTQSYVANGWDYVCFTDNQELLENGHAQWRIRPLHYTERDNTRNARWHKMFPHIILEEYDVSFYMDANINVKNSMIFDYIEDQLLSDPSEILGISEHAERNCLYREAEVCMLYNVDRWDVIEEQVSIIKQSRYPESNGLVDSSMIYRRHEDERLKLIMEDWWWWVSNYSKRDQLSFNFVIWTWRDHFKVHLFKERFAHNDKYLNSFYHIKARE